MAGGGMSGPAPGRPDRPTSLPRMLVALAGGVGAARFLRGLVRVLPPAEITAVVNIGDDTKLHGLHISPDLDTVLYTLAGAINAETGWGLTGEILDGDGGTRRSWADSPGSGWATRTSPPTSSAPSDWPRAPP